MRIRSKIVSSSSWALTGAALTAIAMLAPSSATADTLVVPHTATHTVTASPKPLPASPAPQASPAPSPASPAPPANPEPSPESSPSSSGNGSSGPVRTGFYGDPNDPAPLPAEGSFYGSNPKEPDSPDPNAPKPDAGTVFLLLFLPPLGVVDLMIPPSKQAGTVWSGPRRTDLPDAGVDQPAACNPDFQSMNYEVEEGGQGILPC
jgi:hypothetical protein